MKEIKVTVYKRTEIFDHMKITADKGISTVVMNFTKYNKKIHAMLVDCKTYINIKDSTMMTN